jgi:hypothetical protein
MGLSQYINRGYDQVRWSHQPNELSTIDEVVSHWHGSWLEWLEYGQIYTERIASKGNGIVVPLQILCGPWYIYIRYSLSLHETVSCTSACQVYCTHPYSRNSRSLCKQQLSEPVSPTRTSSIPVWSCSVTSLSISVIVHLHWYDLGTIPTCRPMQAEGFRCISVKLQQKPMTYHIQEADDSQHVQGQRHYALHSTASNPRNARCSRSVPPITVSTLVSYVTFLSLIIFKIIPHPMTLLIAFPLQVIISYLILYRLLSLTYCRITMYPHYLSITRSSSPLVLSCISTSSSWGLLFYAFITLFTLIFVSRACSH